jgi:hypothetical protein
MARFDSRAAARQLQALPLFSGQFIVAKIVAADRAAVGTDLAATP